MRRSWLVVAIALLAATVLATPTAGAASTDVELVLPDGFAFQNTTALVGALDLEDARLNETGFVNVRSLDAPDTIVFVCPHEGGQQDEVPPLPQIEDRCRGEDRYVDPTITAQGRTWLQTRADVTVTQPLPGTLTMLWSDGPTRLASTMPGEPFHADVTGDAMAFTPTRATSEILIEASGGETWYNGTDWIFYLEGPDTLTVQAEGVHAQATEPFSMSLREAPIPQLREANDPHLLLELQDAALGPGEREPVQNMTRVFGEHAQNVHLINGALLGHLEGTMGERGLDPGPVTLIRVDQADLSTDGEMLGGDADVLYTHTGASFAKGAQEAQGVPWLVVGVLWVGAVASLGLREAPARPDWHRFLGLPMGVVAFLVWDVMFHRLTGVSAFSLARGEATLGEWLAVFGFEIVALLVAWLLVYVPARIIVERWLPQRFAWWARPGIGALALIGLIVAPSTVFVMGELVARL